MRPSITAGIVILGLITAACAQAPATPPIVLTSSPAPTTTLALPSPSAPATAILPTAQSTAATTISAEAEHYLTDALDILQANSINRAEIDWPALRASTLLQARAAQALTDTYPAIRYALRQLGDHHSVLLDPVQTSAWTQAGLGTAIEPEGKLVSETLGYVTLPAFMSVNQELSSAYASRVQALIQTLDAQGACGWIVDVRQNPGGSMWPMLAGIGPILGEGQVGSFIDPDGQQADWVYAEGASKLDDEVIVHVNGDPYQLQNPDPPVAVLIGPQTASAGEAVVVAFQGRPDTRSFGWVTGGRTTSNKVYLLSDGATILLTVATYADRTGRLYGHAISPDDIVSDLPDTVPDEVITAASQWLMEQPACAKAR